MYQRRTVNIKSKLNLKSISHTIDFRLCSSLLIFISVPFANSDTVQNINTKDQSEPRYSSDYRYDSNLKDNLKKSDNPDIYYDLKNHGEERFSAQDRYSKLEFNTDNAYNKFYTTDTNAYSNYNVYRKYYLNPQNPLPKSSTKFKVSSRIIKTRYGQLQGIVLSMDEYKYLKPLEVYLGVPYATPPIGSNRFSPTRTPSPWDGIRLSDRPGPACPQRVPDLSNDKATLEKMPKGRLDYLKRLIPYLQNQSEDCLYMNIFAPLQMDETKLALPVVVYVHGESFEWNSGNPYDGAVLASYSDVIVVTINYRLGLFGFLNANPTPHLKARVANYGLMDQIAALHWIQQNIALFGGDPGNVTMMGHGSGAACINFLMISPTVMPGLFHRAVLLSGSAFSSWAIVDDPVYYAIKLANHLNCTIPEDLAKNHEIIVDCLREADIGDLLTAEITSPNFLTAFGPSVDGVVIKRDYAKDFLTNFPTSELQTGPLNNMNANLNIYSKHSDRGRKTFTNKYDLLFGVVTSEALSKFSAQDIQNGFEAERRDKILRTYVRNAYTYHLSEIFYTIVNEYTDWERMHPMNTRDATVSALSDAQYVAPLVQCGDLLSAVKSTPSQEEDSPRPPTKSFFYVFEYQTKDGDYPQRMGSVHGEELPYLFGAPLVEGFGHFPQNYTKSEVALSEAFMLYISNFARTGNPNEHFKQDVVLPASRERNKFRSISWDEYDSVHQKYLEIGMKPKMKNHFRAHQLSVWLRLIPELHRAGMEDVVARHNLFRNHNDPDLYEGLIRPDPLSRSTSYDSSVDFKRQHVIANTSNYMDAITTAETSVTTCSSVFTSIVPGGNLSSDTVANLEAAGYAAYSTALSVTIAIGCSLLILNVLIFAGVYYQRDKSRSKPIQHSYGQKHFETISGKHSHYHIDPSQAPSIVVNIERQNRITKKNNIAASDEHINTNLKGPLGCDFTSMQIGHKPSSPSLSIENTMLSNKFVRTNSSFRMPNQANYGQVLGYATLPKNTGLNDRLNKLPPNGAVTMHCTDRSESSSAGSVSGVVGQHATLRRGKPIHGASVPQAAMNEMRV